MFNILLLLTLTLSACGLGEDREKPLIMTSLFPQYDIARHIGGDAVDVEFILPAGVDAHNFEPTPRKVLEIFDADLLIYTGNQMEPWVQRMIASSNRQDMNMLDLSKHVELMDLDGNHHDQDEQDHIDVFELLNQQNNERLAYVHGSHWHGNLPAIAIGETLTLGANIGDGNITFDLGDEHTLEASIHAQSTDDLISIDNQGEYVDIYAQKDGIASLSFALKQGEETLYQTPTINIVVGDGEQDLQEDIDTFEIINRATRQRVAYVHDNHWHGQLPGLSVADAVTLDANIKAGDTPIFLTGDYELSASLTDASYESIVEIDNHGDHLTITALDNGVALIRFDVMVDGVSIYQTPNIQMVVSEDTQDHVVYDPHIWNDPINMKQMVNAVKDALNELLPEEAERFEARASEYNAALDDIHEAFLAMRDNIELHVMMHGGHNAFGYLMNRYDLDYINPYRGFSPDAEPTPQALANMIDRMKAYDIEHLFSEMLIDPKVADAISSETGAIILYLYAGENLPKDRLDEGFSMIDVFNHNLEQLKIGLRYHE